MPHQGRIPLDQSYSFGTGLGISENSAPVQDTALVMVVSHTYPGQHAIVQGRILTKVRTLLQQSRMHVKSARLLSADPVFLNEICLVLQSLAFVGLILNLCVIAIQFFFLVGMVIMVIGTESFLHNMFRF